MTDSNLKYPATGKYQPYEDCEWTVNAGKMALSFASMDMDVCGGWCDWVEYSSIHFMQKWSTYHDDRFKS